MRVNAITLLRFFLLGYRLQPKYFTDYSDRYIQGLTNCKQTMTTGDAEACKQTQALIDLLTVCMSLYSGHPEIYIDIQERIGELLYDHSDKLTSPSESDIEKAKQGGLWTSSMLEQETLAKYEDTLVKEQVTG